MTRFTCRLGTPGISQARQNEIPFEFPFGELSASSINISSASSSNVEFVLLGGSGFKKVPNQKGVQCDKSSNHNQ